MNDITNTPTSMRWVNVVLIGLFTAMLWLPVLDAFCHIDWTRPRNENRAMAVFPKPPTDWHGLQVYVGGLEAYFNDHFGFRKCLVQWNNRFRTSLFKDNNTRDVLIGKDGWLFYTMGDSIDHYRGVLQFTPERLHDWQVLLEKRRDWLARRGIAYLFVVTPDKHSVYPEELPDWVVKVHPQTKLDQFVAYLHEHSTVPILDLRDVVRSAKAIHPTFLKNDAHWNFFGSFVGYQELMRTLAAQLPSLEPLPLTDFTLTNQLETGGDLARFLGVNMVESNYFAFVPNSGLPQFATKQSPPDHPKDPKFTTNLQAKGRAMLFQDSFAMGWIQFLGYHFNQVTYLWHYDLDAAWIEREQPELVIRSEERRVGKGVDLGG